MGCTTSSSSKVEPEKHRGKDMERNQSVTPLASHEQPDAPDQTGAQATPSSFERRVSGDSQDPERYRPWSAELEKDLQDAVDRVFATEKRLGDLNFSLTIADPMLDGCPLIGCSSGFGTLCGYEMEEIVGRNCRFLVDPVPPEQVDQKTRDRARQFCECVRDGSSHSVMFPPLEPWMPPAVAGEIFCAQANARKDGKVFRNMFYLVAVELDDHPYILGLQTELKEESAYREACATACKLLSQNRGEVDGLLARKFWFSGPVRRQDELGEADELKPM